MAKTSVVNRELKRTRLEAKYRNKYNSLKAELKECYAQLSDEKADVDAIFTKIESLQDGLEKLPRNSSQKRRRNRCELTGRSRGVYRRFKLGRSMLRKLAMMGHIPGIRKASW